MAVNSIQAFIPQRSNINVTRRINMDNTYSVRNMTSQRILKQTPQLERNDSRNSATINKIKNLKAEINEIRRQPSENITNILRERENTALQGEINELNESTRISERYQIENIEEINANIAQGGRPSGVGARLISNFFSNLTPNLGGKVDTLA